MWLRWDQVEGKLRGWGDIHDRQGDAGDYNVKITNIRLLRNGTVIATSKDADGWQSNHDHGYTSTVNCRDGNWVVAADMWWENMKTHDKSATALKTNAEYIDC